MKRLILAATLSSAMLSALIASAVLFVGLDDGRSASSLEDQVEIERSLSAIRDENAALLRLMESSASRQQGALAERTPVVGEDEPKKGTASDEGLALSALEAEVQELRETISLLGKQLAGLAAAISASALYGDLDWERVRHAPPPLTQREIIGFPVGMPYSEVVKRCGLPLQLNGSILEVASATFRAIENNGAVGQTTIFFAGGLVTGQ